MCKDQTIEAGCPDYPNGAEKVPKMTLAAVGSLLMLAALDQTIVSTALPTIMIDLEAFDQMTWVVTAYLMTSIVVAPFYGKLGDMIGRKVVMQFAVLIFLLGSLLSGIANNLLTLISARAIQGIGGGGLFVLALTLVADLVAPRDRSKIQGLFAAVFGISSILGPLLGGFFVDNFSWHWIFLINIPICLIAQIIFHLNFKVEQKKSYRQIDFMGGLFLCISLSSLVLLCSLSGREIKLGSNSFFLLIILWLFFLILFVRTELKASDPLVPMSLFRYNNFSAYVIVGFLSGCILLSTLTFTPIFLQLTKGYTPTGSGLQILPLTLGIIISTSLAGLFISKTGRYKWLPIIGNAINILALLLMSQVTPETGIISIGSILLLIGIGLGPQLSVVTTAVQNTTKRNEVGTATATLTMFRQIGSASGVAVFSAIFIFNFSKVISDVPDIATLNQREIFSGRIENLASMSTTQFKVIEQGIAYGIEVVFLGLALVAVLGLVASLITKEVALKS